MKSRRALGGLRQDKAYLAFKYTLFAAFSIFTNLGMQYLTARIIEGKWQLYACLITGTLGGLVVKYLLDKHFIFYYQVAHIREEGVRFFLYSLMGIATTLIFWGTEIAFEMAFRSPYARYMGGLLGLIVGYAVKYRLDKRFVFVCPGEDSVS
ncbi:MAG: GtrA family protein [Deltaproteobacteria bacterium]|nr:GtrA family protein [Deltaproteobacteria bacterium]